MNATALILTAFMLAPLQDFKSDQQRYSRVRTAYADKKTQVSQLLSERQLELNSLQILIRAFKKEELVELWGKNKSDLAYKLITSYRFCSSSGSLGPKRKKGDYQIPEGFYYIDRFNPASSFYLSLGLNYPNKSDKLLGHSTNPGGDIFIHGDCVTIGCIPITDEKIKELYVFAVEAKTNGQAKIPVHIFPAKLDDSTFATLKATYGNRRDLVQFWENLKEGYSLFEANRVIPKIEVDADGIYQYK